ncbi:MAG TPA: UDP-N-acetylmuramate--L-alanine ligase [Deltaproteobacteria bacterium]|nr:UDP-N-acetylmuramate--L-alanine ligase [Deltaproteobacteria bacterium]HNQ85672.1 UDP-N-acetylmuramate--L-alanine ligase [Deltaproteobacteria bacterium]HNS89861.1 UDP-N-acetylmuramate--L-alanine ligase [Deltaproteobacteria bacterium]HOA44757.1 UDP-N-acetylmuramate--L-alanine ligase [Deltaproteobacteria bacterium]HOC75765.1 UDP-N-acetylmuramate--L-alanine ligase [Deltaproteobacteria bacterium]
MFRGITRIHFVGIGGIGMSGIAELLLNLGFTISGSDVADSDTVQRLRSLGAVIHIGHRPENIGDAQVVVYSSAVKLDNPECAAARARTLPVIPRAEMLAELMRMKFSIAIAGTHGKTTTTSMLATILAMAGKDPTAVIGGRLDMFGSNARLGEGELLVAEADESDRSFLKLTPIVAVVTNIEEEHMDCYRDIDDIRDTYVQFLNKVPFFGFDMVCLDDANIQYILPLLERKVITYGSHTQAIYRYTEPRFSGLQTSFTAHRKGSVLGEISLGVPGKHNCLNALAAMGTALELGIDFEVIRRGLDEFKGVQRRCHVRGEKRGITVMDDYGHHPTEIRMTLSAIKNGFPKRRVIAVFQPHRYTRTRDLFDDFVNSFYDAGRLYVTEIYPASEQPIEGVSGRRLFEEIKNHGYRDAFFVEDKDDIPGTLQKVLKKGDLVVFLGAGDVWRQGLRILERLG